MSGDGPLPRPAVVGDSNRVGLRLGERPLERIRTDELSSECMVRGTLQPPVWRVCAVPR